MVPGCINERVAPNVWAMRLGENTQQAAVEDGPLPAFASQVMPDAHALGGASINALARAAFEGLRGLDDGAWRLHVLTPPTEPPTVSPRRAVLVAEAIDELLKKKQRRLLRTRIEPSAPRIDDIVVQVLLTDAEGGYMSVSRDARISRFPNGVPELPQDSRPPSRAYLKLLEVEAHLGERIEAGETCVDLGGSPGGWTFIALDRGASCISVDRSPLRDDIMESPRFTFVKGDAFTYEPPHAVDWLLCDVIATPDRSLGMLAHWLDAKLCRRFCVTLKFKGDVDVTILQGARAELDRRGVRYRMRRLTVNKNEVTVFGAAS